MHKIQEKEFTFEDFSCEHLMMNFCYETKIKFESGKEIECNMSSMNILGMTIEALNSARQSYLETKDKIYWWQMIQLLPSSYNQTRNVMMNYEVLSNIYKSRKDHKLDEWKVHETPEKHEFRNKDFASGKWGFCDWIETLPYSELICGNKFDPHNTLVGKRLDAGIID